MTVFIINWSSSEVGDSEAKLRGANWLNLMAVVELAEAGCSSWRDVT